MRGRRGRAVRASPPPPLRLVGGAQALRRGPQHEGGAGRRRAGRWGAREGGSGSLELRPGGLPACCGAKTAVTVSLGPRTGATGRRAPRAASLRSELCLAGGCALRAAGRKSPEVARVAWGALGRLKAWPAFAWLMRQPSGPAQPSLPLLTHASGRCESPRSPPAPLERPSGAVSTAPSRPVARRPLRGGQGDPLHPPSWVTAAIERGCGARRI